MHTSRVSAGLFWWHILYVMQFSIAKCELLMDVLDKQILNDKLMFLSTMWTMTLCAGLNEFFAYSSPDFLMLSPLWSDKKDSFSTYLLPEQ